LIASDAVLHDDSVTVPTSVLRAGVGFGLLLLSAGAAAQTAGSIAGVVVDATTQNPVAGAMVTARSPAMVGEQSAVTDEAGVFEITLLPAGTYGLAVRRDGFEAYAPDGLAVRGRRVKVRLQLLPEKPPPPPVPPPPDAVEFDDGTMTPPVMLSGPPPEYTHEAIERGVQGQMVVRCVLGVDGSVRKCRVLKGLPFMNFSVLEALERRRYRPATAHGKPVDVYYTFNLRLTLPH
jgi:TonB family protein